MTIARTAFLMNVVVSALLIIGSTTCRERSGEKRVSEFQARQIGAAFTVNIRQAYPGQPTLLVALTNDSDREITIYVDVCRPRPELCLLRANGSSEWRHSDRNGHANRDDELTDRRLTVDIIGRRLSALALRHHPRRRKQRNLHDSGQLADDHASHGYDQRSSRDGRSPDDAHGELALVDHLYSLPAII